MLNAVLITEEKIPVCWAGPRDGLPAGPRPNADEGPRIGPGYMAGPTWGWAVAQQAGHNDVGHLIKESWRPHSIGRNGFRALNSPRKGSEVSPGRHSYIYRPLGQAKGSDTHINSVHSLTPSLSSLFPLGYSKLT